MTNPVIAPMVIAAVIHKYFRRFENAGAINPETAKTLQSLGLNEGFLFHRMLRNRVFIEVSPGKYYVDRANYDNFRKQRRKRAFLIMGSILLFLVIINIILLTFN